MNDAIIIFMIIGLVIGSLIGGLILRLLAKYIGKVERVKYWNSVLISFLSSIIYLIVTYSLGTDILKMGIEGMIIYNLIFLSVLYISFGKMIWKCTWLQSFKSNIIWILVYTVTMAIMFGNS